MDGSFAEAGFANYNSKTKQGTKYQYSKDVSTGRYYITVEALDNLNKGFYNNNRR